MSRWFRVAEEKRTKTYSFYIRQNINNGYPYIGMTQDESNDAFKQFVETKAEEVKNTIPGVINYTLKFDDIWYNAGAVFKVELTGDTKITDIEKIFDEDFLDSKFIDWIEVIPGD